MNNLRSPNARRRHRAGFDEFERLPRPLRRWLAQAALPWSVRSVRAAWRRVLREAGGSEVHALRRLDRIEAHRLACEVANVWGPDYPKM